MTDPVVPLECNLYGHPLAGLLWERYLEEILFSEGWERVVGWECLYLHRKAKLFQSTYVDDLKMVGKKESLKPMWDTLGKRIDLEGATPLMAHVYLGCNQRPEAINEQLISAKHELFTRLTAATVKEAGGDPRPQESGIAPIPGIAPPPGIPIAPAPPAPAPAPAPGPPIAGIPLSRYWKALSASPKAAAIVPP